MKQIKSYTLEPETIERVKAVAAALHSSDSVAVELLLNLGYHYQNWMCVMNDIPTIEAEPVIKYKACSYGERLEGCVKNGETEPEV